RSTDVGGGTVHPDHHIQFGHALYSLPTGDIGKRVDVRGDSRSSGSTVMTSSSRMVLEAAWWPVVSSRGGSEMRASPARASDERRKSHSTRWPSVPIERSRSKERRRLWGPLG